MKDIFVRIYIIVISSLILLAFFSFLMLQNQNKITQNHKNHKQAHFIVDEIRRNSAELTSYCHTYILTGDKVWEKKYQKVLVVRNGKTARFDGKTIEFQDIMKTADFEKKELDKLLEIENKLDSLIKIEIAAFNAMKGLFVDVNGNYTIKRFVNKKFASRLVSNEKYYNLKYELVKLINCFLAMLDVRLEKLAIKDELIGKRYLIIIICLVLFLLGISFFVYFFVRNKTIAQRKAEVALIESEKKFSNIFKLSPNAFIVVLLEGRKIIDVNESFSEMSGYTKEEVLGKTPVELGLWFFDNERRLFLDNLLLEGVLRSSEVRFRIKGGVILDVFISASILKVNNRQVILAEVIDITQRKLAESALKKSEEKMRYILDTFSDGIYINTPDYKIEYANTSLQKKIGHNPTGEDCYRAIYNRDSRCSWCIYEKLHKKKVIDYELETESGIFVEVNNFLFEDDKKLTVFHDISERKRINEAIKNIVTGVSVSFGDNFFDSMVTHLAKALKADYTLIGEVNPDHDTVVTLSFCKEGEIIDNIEYNQAGTPCEGVLENGACSYNDKVWELFPDDAFLVKNRIEGYAGISLYNSKKQVFGLIVALFCHPIENSEFTESILQIFAAQTALEIERKQAEKELQESEEWFSTITEQSLDGITVATPEGVYVFVNPAFCVMMGYSKNELLQMTVFDMKQNKGEEGRKGFKKSKSKVNGAVIEVVLQRKDGSTFISEVTGKPINIANRNLVLEIVKDITERKQDEQELKKAKEKADDANSAKSEFLANMSHEIRTPMNAVLGFTDILKALEIDPKKSSYLENIQNSGHILLSLINDILDLSKVEAGKMELQERATSLTALYAEMKNLFSQQMEDKRLLFELILEDSIPSNLLLDESRLRQVMINLLANAIKFTKKGFVKLVAGCQSLEESTHDKVNLILKISDSGIGIPKAQQDLIFSSFEQVKGQKSSEYGGTGLGLAIAQRIVRLMGGTISVESKVGLGSTFTLFLPNIKVADEVDVIPDIIDLETVSFSPATILIIDDIDYNREILSTYLSGYSFAIYTAANGKEAIEKAKEIIPDIILLDMKMPVMDGYEAAEKLNSDDNTKHIPIIAITASALKNVEERVKTNCQGFLRKPISKMDAVKELMKFLAHDVVTSPIMADDVLSLESNFVVSLELKKQLKQDYLPTCLQLQQSNDLAAIALFAKSLSGLADSFNEDVLAVFAKKLLFNATKVFDIDEILKSLEQFIQAVKS